MVQSLKSSIFLGDNVVQPGESRYIPDDGTLHNNAVTTSNAIYIYIYFFFFLLLLLLLWQSSNKYYFFLLLLLLWQSSNKY
jgi:hypothetical protein